MLIRKSSLALLIGLTVSFNAWSQSELFADLKNNTEQAKQSKEYKVAEFHQYINKYLDDYELWRDDYTKNLDIHRFELIKKWGRGEVSDQAKQVDYSPDGDVKTVIDYDNNIAQVSVLIDSFSSTDLALKKISNTLGDVTLKKDELKSTVQENIYNNANEQQEKRFIITQTQQQMNDLDIQAERLINASTGIPDDYIYQRAHDKKLALLEQAKIRLDKQNILFEQQSSITTNSVSQPSKKIVNYTVKLPENSLKNRASKFKPLAEKESKNWHTDAALIMAIMHSESSFRPLAKSHVPAFGLMQVVPTSAGHDVNKQVRNIDAPMKVNDLYDPDINVETGSAYLNILNSRYLKAIENDQSRLYCVIAAYNTGAGNVAKAFNKDRSTNINRAAKIINELSPDEVYAALLKNLPYDETKGYLEKVTQRIALYQ